MDTQNNQPNHKKVSNPLLRIFNLIVRNEVLLILWGVYLSGIVTAWGIMHWYSYYNISNIRAEYQAHIEHERKITRKQLNDIKKQIYGGTYTPEGIYTPNPEFRLPFNEVGNVK